MQLLLKINDDDDEVMMCFYFVKKIVHPKTLFFSYKKMCIHISPEFVNIVKKLSINVVHVFYNFVLKLDEIL